MDNYNYINNFNHFIKKKKNNTFRTILFNRNIDKNLELLLNIYLTSYETDIIIIGSYR